MQNCHTPVRAYTPHKRLLRKIPVGKGFGISSISGLNRTVLTDNNQTACFHISHYILKEKIKHKIKCFPWKFFLNFFKEIFFQLLTFPPEYIII